MQTTQYAEGKVLKFESTDAIDAKCLENFKYEGYHQIINYETAEFSAVCPFSGLPDIAEVSITYVPANSCVELKSLKYYLLSYRQVGVYQEAATNHIFSDLWNCLEPQYLQVETIYNTRGGIDSNCLIEKGEVPNN
jgi:7-cyano-7-deazaguanine reductase